MDSAYRWSLSFLLSVLLALVVSAPLSAKECYRILYSDDSIRGIEKNDLKYGPERNPDVEEAYGGALYYVVPSQGKPPKKPRLVNGVLIPTSAVDDEAWVRAERPEDNPAYIFEKATPNLGGKHSEYLFVKKYAPELAPPRLELGGKFLKSVLPKDKLEQWRNIDELSAEDRKALRAYITGIVNGMKPEGLLALRDAIHGAMGGKSILKANERDHSEGNNPKTHKPWDTIWKGYVEKTRPEIERIQEKIEEEGSSTLLQEYIFDMPFIDGRVLEELILDPDSIVVQKMIDIEKEVRIHVVMGEVLDGATFLRMYPLGTYLTAEETARVEEAMREKFLKNLDRRYRPWASSTDFVIEKGTGKLYILDLNPGYYSGYFFPNEDLFTTHRLAHYFSGRKSKFLLAWDDFTKASMDGAAGKKATVLKKIRHDYRDFIYGQGDDAYDHESFWDRVIRHYVDEHLRRNPTGIDLDLVLQHLKMAGLRSTSIYYQLINEAQEVHRVRLPGPLLRRWVKELERIAKAEEQSFAVTVRGGKLVVEEKKAADAKRVKDQQK